MRPSSLKEMNASLPQLQLTSLQRSCIALGGVSERLLSDRALGVRLHQLASRLPGPLPPDEEEAGSTLSIEEALPLTRGAVASLDFLCETRQLSSLGERVAGGLKSTLETLAGRLGQRLRSRTLHRFRGLYVIIDPLVTGGREPEQIAEQALEGGAAILQLRDKERDKGRSHPLAAAIKSMCDEKDALFIVNDHADLAAAVQAHGLHLGQDDLSVSDARRSLDAGQIVGRSNHLLEEAIESQAQGADYIAVGAMYPTTSKDQPIVGGVSLLRAVKESVDAPVAAIGGITQERVEEVARAGADAVCVISAVGLAANPRDAAEGMVEAMRRAGGRG